MEIKNKTIVVTGGASGLGEATVRSFLKASSFKLEKIQFMKRMKNLLIEAPSRKPQAASLTAGRIHVIG